MAAVAKAKEDAAAELDAAVAKAKEAAETEKEIALLKAKDEGPQARVHSLWHGARILQQCRQEIASGTCLRGRRRRHIAAFCISLNTQ